MDNNVPKDGYIRTARDLIVNADGSRGVRDSLHGSLNHAVMGHMLSSWDEHKYLYIIPIEKIPNIVGGTPVDIFTHGSVKIPRGTVIVRQNSSIPAGKYKITNARLIDEFKDLKGIKVVETAQKPHSVSAQILKKMGYEVQNGGLGIGWDDKVDKSFLSFLRKKGFISAIHSGTPNAKCEQMIEFIFNRAHFDRNWEVVENGKVIFNYKDEYLKLIPYLEELSKKYNYPLDFDVKKLQIIIQKSATPKEAAACINSELKICSEVPEFRLIDEKNMITQSKVLIGSANEICRKMDEIVISKIQGKLTDEVDAEFAKKMSTVNITDW